MRAEKLLENETSLQDPTKEAAMPGDKMKSTIGAIIEAHANGKLTTAQAVKLIAACRPETMIIRDAFKTKGRKS